MLMEERWGTEGKRKKVDRDFHDAHELRCNGKTKPNLNKRIGFTCAMEIMTKLLYKVFFR